MTDNTYISGIAALNIPCPEDTWGDAEIFLLSSQEELLSNVAGSGPDAIVNTDEIFGDDGIYDCAKILAELGYDVDEGSEIRCASHYRAFCDLLLSHLFNRQSSYLDPAEFFRTGAHLTVLEFWLDRCEHHLTEKHKPAFDQWRKINLNGHSKKA